MWSKQSYALVKWKKKHPKITVCNNWNIAFHYLHFYRIFVSSSLLLMREWFHSFHFSLRDYMRSESEKSFDQQQIRRARMKSLGLAYLSPQNKSLAQSFRYMRNKPTIIAFKTPSLENCEQRDSSSSIGSSNRKFHLIRNSSLIHIRIHIFILFFCYPCYTHITIRTIHKLHPTLRD